MHGRRCELTGDGNSFNSCSLKLSASFAFIEHNCFKMHLGSNPRFLKPPLQPSFRAHSSRTLATPAQNPFLRKACVLKKASHCSSHPFDFPPRSSLFLRPDEYTQEKKFVSWTAIDSIQPRTSVSLNLNYLLALEAAFTLGGMIQHHQGRTMGMFHG